MEPAPSLGMKDVILVLSAVSFVISLVLLLILMGAAWAGRTYEFRSHP
jgi:hypothetical protein